MEQLFIPGSVVADCFYLGPLLLAAASLIAGYVGTIAGGAGLILIPAFLMVDLPPQVALAQKKLVSTIGTVAAIKNFMKSSSIVWHIVPVGTVAILIRASVDAEVILIFPVETINYIILAFLPISLLATLFEGVLLKEEDKHDEIKKSVIAIFLTCLIVGFCDGFFGPGTGSIFIIALFVIDKLSLLQTSATPKAFNFASNVGTFVAFLITGRMTFLIEIPMILASLLDNHFGSLRAINSNGEVIRKVLIVAVLLIIVSMAYKTFSA